MSCFYCENIPAAGAEVELDENEAHHIIASRRQKVGDSVCLIDGNGTRAVGTVESVTKKSVTLSIRACNILPAPNPNVCIASALPKGERQRVLFDMLGQLGANSIKPLHCERSVVRAISKNKDRWQRYLREACKQSANPHFPIIHSVHTTMELAKDISRDGLYLVADSSGENISIQKIPDEVTVCVGPEGGFTDSELAAMTDAGARLVSFSKYTLRIETACVAALTYIRSLYK